MSDHLSKKENKIAIIGIGCRFSAGIVSPQSFWNAVTEGRNGITEIPEDRWNTKWYSSSLREKKGKSVSRQGGFIENISEFDAGFFNLSPRESKYLDPQQRLLLEITWEAFEDSGIIPEAVAGSPVGVFIGGFTLDYKIIQFGGNNYSNISPHTAVGSMMTLLSNRISHSFDLRGPSLTVDTACSSSLVAVHLAIKALQNNECSLALAGGIMLNIAPQYTIAESQGGFLSPEGLCKTYDASADGYVRGEGAGVVMLKPLEKALEDGDRIYSVICGSAVNQDGNTPGITVPRGESQEAVIRRALSEAGLKPEQIQYVEAHGTGTSVGDPIEANTLGQIFSENRSDVPCYVGSVKTNIGHTESAAGAAGLIKASLAVYKGLIPPNLHFRNPNPNIHFDKFKIKVPVKLMQWPECGKRRAAVNSFGFGGTNAHLIIEEAPACAAKKKYPVPNLLLWPISARSEPSLKAFANALIDIAKGSEWEDIYALGRMLAFHRSNHRYRALLAFSDRESLLSRLAALSSEGIDIHQPPQEEVRPVFIFSGMGPQWWGMGQELYREQPVYRDVVDKIDELFRSFAGWSLLDEMLKTEAETSMHQTRVSQPANFALQAGLFTLLKSWGITPSAIVGHSTGELAASYCAGVYSLEDAVRIIYFRSSLQQSLSGTGRMAALGLSEDEAAAGIEAFKASLSIAAINSHSSVTVAGESAALESLKGALEPKGVFFKYLKVDIPFHSPVMEKIQQSLLENLSCIKPGDAVIPLFSTVTGEAQNGREMDAHYWWNNVRKPVRFAKAIDGLLEKGHTLFFEVGPHPVLSGSVSEILTARGKTYPVISSLRRGEPEMSQLLKNIDLLYQNGVELSLKAFYPAPGPQVRFPLYPWDRQEYWAETAEAKTKRLKKNCHPLLGQRSSYSHYIWDTEADTERLPYLRDHRIQGNTLYPAAGHVAMIMQALNEAFGSGVYCLDEVQISKALFLNEAESVPVRLFLDPGTKQFEICTWKDESPETVSRISGGRFSQTFNTKARQVMDLEALKAKMQPLYDKANFYARIGGKGFNYGPLFQGISEVCSGNDEILAYIDGSYLEDSADYQIHPALIDCCFQAFVAFELQRIAGETGEYGNIRLPVLIHQVIFYGRASGQLLVHVRKTIENEQETRGDIRLYDTAGKLIAEFLGFTVRSMDNTGSRLSDAVIEKWLYQLDWIPDIDKNDVSQKNAGAETASPTDNKLWLVLEDTLSIARGMAAELEKQGFSIQYINQSEIDYKNRGSFTALLKSLDKTKLAGILHAWNLDLPLKDDYSLAEIDSAKNLGCFSLLTLIQGLNDLEIKTKIWVLTQGAQSIEARTMQLRKPSILQHPVWGVARLVSNQESVGLWGGIIDLDPVNPLEGIDLIVKGILGKDREDQTAFRKGRRYVARLNRIEKFSRGLAPEFDPGSCYLITGAFGSLGRLTIDWMAAKGARNFIFTSTSPVPPPDEWNNLLPDSPAYKRVEYLRQLKESGIAVTIAVLDVTDYEAWERTLREYKEGGNPPIRGVMSIAGLVRDQLISNMDLQTFDEVYNPKAAGSWILHKLFEKEQLDFFIMYSSIAAMVTSSGQANYAAGNGFIDALARYRQAAGLPALSIAWGPWAVGMIRELNLEQLYKQKGMEIIYPVPGLQILEKLIFQTIPYAGVVNADWRRLIDSGPKSSTLYLDHLADSGDQSLQISDAERLGAFQAKFQAAANHEERLALSLETFIFLIRKVLHSETKGLESSVSLNTLGIDSMMSIELRNRVQLNTGAVIGVVDILGGSTIHSLAEKITTELENNLGLRSIDEVLSGVTGPELELLLEQMKGLSEEQRAALLSGKEV